MKLWVEMSFSEHSSLFNMFNSMLMESFGPIFVSRLASVPFEVAINEKKKMNDENSKLKLQ